MTSIAESAQASIAKGPRRLPALLVEGAPVQARALVEPGSGSTFALALFPAAVFALGMCVVTYGVALVAFVLSPLVLWYQNRKALALIRGSCVRIAEDQLPELHACVASFADRLGLREAPEAYLIETNTINAAAIKYGGRQVLLFTDDLVDACLRSANPRALSFVVGHELAHVALGHNGLIRSFIKRVSKKLSRLDEYSADRVALALVGDRSAGMNGLLAMIAGPQMMPYIDIPALERQCEHVVADAYATKAEKLLTHPLLLRRMHRMLGASQRAT